MQLRRIDVVSCPVRREIGGGGRWYVRKAQFFTAAAPQSNISRHMCGFQHHKGEILFRFPFPFPIRVSLQQKNRTRDAYSHYTRTTNRGDTLEGTLALIPELFDGFVADPPFAATDT